MLSFREIGMPESRSATPQHYYCKIFAYSYRVWITLIKLLYTPLPYPESNPIIHQGERLCGRLLPTVLRVSEKNSSRDCLKIPKHGLAALPSSASWPRRQTPHRWHTISRNPCSCAGCGTTKRRSFLLPSGGARLRSLDAGATSASRSFHPPWPIPLPRS